MPRSGAVEINTNTELMNRNLCINSDMKIFQRGSSIAGTGGAQFITDRTSGWFSDNANVTGKTVAQSSLPAGFEGVNQVDGRALRLFGTLTALTPGFNRRQRIESIRLQPKLSNVMSFGCWVHSTNFQNGVIQILQPTTGADDDWSTSAIIAGGSATTPLNDGDWTFLKLENLPIENLHGLEFRVALSNAAATVFTDTYVTEMMCNWGPVLKPWRLMGDNFAEEVAHCQRYFCKSYALDVAPGTPTAINGDGSKGGVSGSGANGAQFDHRFPVRMRAVPAASTYAIDGSGPGNMTRTFLNGGGTSTATIGGGAIGVIENIEGITGFSGAIPTNGQGYMFHYTADAEL